MVIGLCNAIFQKQSMFSQEDVFTIIIKKMNRIVWIDLLRGICMMLILWFHTEMYFADKDIIPYNIYVANSLTVFYFISGYLFYHHNTFSLYYKIKSIIRGLIIPYFFFTCLLAFPKAYINNLPIIKVIMKILIGNGSWFITSLITAEIIFSIILYLNKKWVLHILPIIAIISAYFLTETAISMHYNYWNFHNALIGVFFLYFGYHYHQYESYFSFSLFKIMFIFLIFFITKNVEFIFDISLLLDPVLISNYPIFIVDTVSCILFLVPIVKNIPHIKWLSWTGKRSLVYYFFCGAIPMSVTKTIGLTGIIYNNNYILIPIVFIIVYLLTTLVVYVSYKYFSFILR